MLDWARQWQAAEKIVYSTTLSEPRSARTRIERVFDPGAVRRLKADAERLDLALAEERRFGNGVVILRYAVRG